MKDVLKSGDHLWRLPFHYDRQSARSPVAVRVKKVGRLYAEMDDNHRVNLQTLCHTDKSTGICTAYFKSRQELQEILDRDMAFSRLHNACGYLAKRPPLNSDQLNRICDVLEGKAGWETLSTFDGQKP